MNYSKAYGDTLKRLHLCVRCKNEDAYTMNGRSLCQDCAQKDKDRKRRDNSTEEARQKRCEQRRKLVQRHIENHECTVCGKKLQDDCHYKRCDSCRYYNKMRQRTSKTFTRGLFGVCWQCNKEPCATGKKLCQSCYEKRVEIARENLKKVNLENHIWRNLNLKRE